MGRYEGKEEEEEDARVSGLGGQDWRAWGRVVRTLDSGMAVMMQGVAVKAPAASPRGDTQHCWKWGSGAPGQGRGVEMGFRVTSRPRRFLPERVSAT